MLNILFIFFQIILLVIFFTTLILMFLWSISNIKNKSSFVTTPQSVLKDIKESLLIKDHSVVYDLGSGDGRVLFYLSKFNKKAKYIGIENGIFPLLLSKIERFFKKDAKEVDLKIINNDISKQDLSDATHIFMYLYPTVMDNLLSKFEKELKPGSLVVSLSFKFKDKEPKKEIDLKRNKYQRGRKLYIYEF